MIIDINDISAVTKKVSLGFLQNSLEIVTKNNKSYFFASFSKRNDVYNIIYSAWQETSPPDDIVEKTLDESQKLETASVDSFEGNDGSAITFLPIEKIDNIAETLKIILPISVEKFFDLFIADTAIFSIGDHFTLKGKQFN